MKKLPPNTFICSRTTAWCNEQPCPEAQQIKITYVDTRNCSGPCQLPILGPDGAEWYKIGTNHRVENGKIRRDMGERDVWVVEIRSLSDLGDFISRHGECVVSVDMDGDWEVEIYDGYRE